MPFATIAKFYCLFVFDTEILRLCRDATIGVSSSSAEPCRASIVAWMNSLAAPGAGSGLTVLHGAAVIWLPRLHSSWRWMRCCATGTMSRRQSSATQTSREVGHEASALFSSGSGDLREERGACPERRLHRVHALTSEHGQGARNAASNAHFGGTTCRRAGTRGRRWRACRCRRSASKPTNLSELTVAPAACRGWRLLEDFRGRIDHYKVARDFPAARACPVDTSALRHDFDPQAGQ